MIVSCHVPKTAGTSFGELLVRYFSDRVHLDYGDRVGWDTEEGNAWREERKTSQRPLGPQIECVHGHFYVSKYLDLIPHPLIVTFLRQPVERVVSNFRFLRAHPEIRHPLVAEFHKAKPDLKEWAAWPWARNLQSKVLAGIALENMALVGITEHYRKSIERFDAIFHTKLQVYDQGEMANRSTDEMEATASDREVIRRLNTVDMQLYERALALFENDKRA